ncbi:PKD domain-containing protein [candidate division KSB1 bacterium]|nr:PKD domain-containing protein [candidate division KSB1 bacterium]
MNSKNIATLLVTLVMLLSLSGYGVAQPDTLFVLNGSGDPGSNANSVMISLTNTVEVAGMQFILKDSANVLAATTCNALTRAADFSVNIVDHDTACKVIAFSLSGAMIEIGSGPILEILFDVLPSAPLDSVALILSEATVAGVDAQALTIETVNGIFAVGGWQPLADAGGPYSGAVGVPITFDGSNSSDPDDDPLTFAWDFGDGQTGSGDTPMYIYAEPGVYQVSLKVNDGVFESERDLTSATISEHITSDSLALGSGEGMVGSQGSMLPVYLSNENGISAVSFTFTETNDWLDFTDVLTTERTADFTAVLQDLGTEIKVTLSAPAGENITAGEGLIITLICDIATDAEPGAIELALTNVQLFDENGYEVVGPFSNGTFTILPQNHPPMANAGGPYNGLAGQEIQFDGSGSSDPDQDQLDYNWDFGDLNTASGVTPVHIYGEPGTYQVILEVDDGRGGIDRDTTSATIHLVNGLDHFSFAANTGESYCVIIEQATLDEVALDPGDEIGVFTPTQLCVGAVEWTGQTPMALTCWQDDSQTPDFDGFIPGEIMYFKIWDASRGTSEEFYAEPTFLKGDGTFAFGPYSHISLLSGSTTLQSQTILLNAGWNWMSFNLIPWQPAPEQVFQELTSLSIVVNQQGQSYIPDVGDWILEMAAGVGYKAHLTATETLELQGEPLAVQTPLPLLAGWNFIGYLPAMQMDVEIALNSILTQIEIVMNDDGQVYIPNVINNMAPLQPGEAYKVYLNQEATLIYPESVALNRTRVSWQNAPQAQHFKFRSRTGDATCLLLESLALDDVQPGDRDEIGVFTQNGLCIGGAVYHSSNAVALIAWHDDPQSKPIDGYVAGDEIQLRYWDADLKQELALEMQPFSESAPYIKAVASTPSSPLSFQLEQNYPNPFSAGAASSNGMNSKTAITYSLPHHSEIKITIYNLLGQQVRMLVDKTQEPGTFKCFWDGKDQTGQDVSSGIYIYTIQAQPPALSAEIDSNQKSFSDSKKLLLLR